MNANRSSQSLRVFLNCPSRVLSLIAATAALFLGRSAYAAEGPADPLAALAPVVANENIDIGNTALIIAHALNPLVNIREYENRLNTLASEMKLATAAARTEKGRLDAMAEVVYDRWGFANNVSLPADVFASFADVLDKRQWNCFSMSMLYIALGERIGLPFDLVSGRGHVFVRCSGTSLYVETTQRGKVYESLDYLETYLPFPCVKPEEYVPVTKREAVAVLLTQTGGAVLALGKAELAHACFQYALQFDPNHAEAHAALGFLYAQVGSIDRAIESFQIAIRYDPKLREAYGGLGAALHAKGDLAGAAQTLQEAVNLCDKQPEPLFNLGQVLYESGDLNGSIRAFHTYTALAPRDPDGFIRLAFPLEDSGRLDEALAAYRDALRINPQHADALVNSGAIFEKQSKWTEAEATYRQGLKASPRNPLAHSGLGRVFTKTEKLDQAARAFDRSLALDSTNPATWIDYAKLARKRGDTVSAIVKLERAVAINPMEAEAHVVLAEVYVERNDMENAAKHARIAKDMGETLPAELGNLVP